MRLLLLILLFSYSCLGATDETPEPNQPNPQQLETNWWLYFNSSDLSTKADLEERIKNSNNNLAQLITNTPSAQQARLRQITDTLENNLRKYAK